MVKFNHPWFNVSVLNITVQNNGFFLIIKYIHEHNVIFNKTNQTCHYFDKMFFSISEPYKLP